MNDKSEMIIYVKGRLIIAAYILIWFFLMNKIPNKQNEMSFEMECN